MDREIARSIVGLVNPEAMPDWAMTSALSILNDVQPELDDPEIEALFRLLRYPSKEVVRLTLQVLSAVPRHSMTKDQASLLNSVTARYAFDSEIVDTVGRIKALAASR
jgi:hypothetical protein